MPALIWDQALEQVAQNFVNTHPLSHNQQRNAQFRALTRDSRAVIGENLAAGYRTFLLADAAWAAEKTESPPGGHYTQMVWANTLRLGCARSNTTKSPYGNYYICNYYPAGNFVGQQPFVPAGGPNPNTAACQNQSLTDFLPTMTFPPGTSGVNNGVLVYVNVNTPSTRGGATINSTQGATLTPEQGGTGGTPTEGPTFIGEAITINTTDVNATSSSAPSSIPTSTGIVGAVVGLIIVCVSSVSM